MAQRMTMTLAVGVTTLVMGLMAPPIWAQQEAAPAAQPPAAESAAQPMEAPVEEAAAAVPAEQPPGAEGAEQSTEAMAGQEAAMQVPAVSEELNEAAMEQEEPAAEEEEEATSTASFYQQLMNIPPYRWDDMIDERRDYLTRRRQARYRDWSRPRRYWHNPWSAARSEAMWAYSNARRDWSRDRSRHHRDWVDAHRWYTNPWSAAQRQWSKALTNYSRLRSLALQEQFENMRYGYGYPGSPFGPYGGLGGPWSPGSWR